MRQVPSIGCHPCAYAIIMIPRPIELYIWPQVGDQPRALQLCCRQQARTTACCTKQLYSTGSSKWHLERRLLPVDGGAVSQHSIASRCHGAPECDTGSRRPEAPSLICAGLVAGVSGTIGHFHIGCASCHRPAQKTCTGQKY